MPLIGRNMGTILGPRGKMPTPVVPSTDIKEEIDKHRKMILIRLRNQPILQCIVGNEKMVDDEVAENVQTVIRSVETKLSKGAKNLESINIKLTMGAPIKVLF
jgi:large subunit ribosomal protein L1